MTSDDRLFRLTELAGIHHDYWDVRGRRHETDRETAVAILAAQGIAADSPAAIAASLQRLEEEPWRERLPPVAVLRDGECGWVHVVLEDSRGIGTWTLQPEHGEPFAFEPRMHDTGERHSMAGRALRRMRLELPQLPYGYHRLAWDNDRGPAETALIVTPGRCYLPPGLEHQRTFGIAAQLYALRRPANLGIGDFTDLGEFIDWSKGRGAAAVGLNPLHALFPTQPERISPYSPNSRRFINPLYLDVSGIEEFADSAEARQLLSTRNVPRPAAGRLVDYDTVSRLKAAAFEVLHRAFRARRNVNADDARTRAFTAYVAQQGTALRHFALHAALCEHFASCDWTGWPAPYRDPASPACRDFAQRHADRLDFHMYLQWLCELQLASAAARADEMAVGIYGDLAVSSSPDGADVWGAQDVFSVGARVGAPPDALAEQGQEWGVVPLNPLAMRRNAYRDVIQLLRANMRHFGALRIDHAMELERLFWIPRGLPNTAGTYVAYPFRDLLGIVALESLRNRCLIIGEDLGTVPDGFRETLNGQRIFSYRVLYFEDEAGHYKAPDAYPQNAAACVSTHDLPTLRGFWEECDLQDRKHAGQYADDGELIAAQRERRKTKAALLQALAHEGLMPPGEHADNVHLSVALAAALHRFLARSPAKLLMVQLDDLAGEKAQINMPGTTDSFPNWRRRIAHSWDELTVSDRAGAILEAVHRERSS